MALNSRAAKLLKAAKKIAGVVTMQFVESADELTQEQIDDKRVIYVVLEI
jgi:hypothetical protein